MSSDKTGEEDRKKGERRILKPLMEKRRRARINESLKQLQTIVLGDRKETLTHRSRLEKADILDMTVTYLKTKMNDRLKENVEISNTCSESACKMTNPFSSGYRACLAEISRYLDHPGMETKFKETLTDFITRNSRKDLQKAREVSNEEQMSQQHRTAEEAPTKSDANNDGHQKMQKEPVCEQCRCFRSQSVSSIETETLCEEDCTANTGVQKCQNSSQTDISCKADQALNTSSHALHCAYLVPNDAVAIFVPQTVPLLDSLHYFQSRRSALFSTNAYQQYETASASGDISNYHTGSSLDPRIPVSFCGPEVAGHETNSAVNVDKYLNNRGRNVSNVFEASSAGIDQLDESPSADQKADEKNVGCWRPW